MRCLNRFGVISVSAVILALCPAVWADDAAADDAADNTYWTLSNLIKGTTPQIRDQINGPLEEQLVRKSEKLAKYIDLKQDLDQRTAKIAAGLRQSSPAFAKAETDLPQAKAELDAAHAKSDGTAAIAAQNRMSADQDVISQAVDGIGSQDADMVKDRKDMDDLKTEIHHLDPVIANAAKARDQLIDGLRTSSGVHGPANGNGKGIIGRIKPGKIVDEHSFTADYELFTITGEDKKAKVSDGFKAVSGTKQKVKLLVVGYPDTSRLKTGSEAIVDEYYQLAGQKQLNKQTFLVAERVTPDEKDRTLEHLLKALDTLHVPANVTFK